MKKMLQKVSLLLTMASTAMMMLPVNMCYAQGTTPDFNQVTQPVVDLINSILGPAIAIVGALGAVYCVFLGVKFAKAEEPQDREKAKTHLKNAIIGFVLIFVLMGVLRGAIGPLTKWATGAK